MEVWTTIILPIISGLVAAIPLVIKLIECAQKAAKEKNWTTLMYLVLSLMAEAEDKRSTGAERADYVIDMIKAMESTLNYDVDEKTVREMMAAIAKASKKINVDKK